MYKKLLIISKQKIENKIFQRLSIRVTNYFRGLKMNLVTLEGTPYEAYYQLGKMFREEITQLINLYKMFWFSKYKLTEDKLNWYGSEVYKLIEKWDKRIAEELKGLADGVGVDLTSIVLLNARYDIVYMFRKLKMLEGCTAVGIQPFKNKDNITIVAQNWDYIPMVKEYSKLFHIKYDDGLEIMYHGEVGIIGQKGFNNYGIGVVVNALHSNLDKFKPAIPFFILMKKVLTASNMKEAVEYTINTPISSSGNIMIGVARGEILDFELAPGDYRVIYPTNGILVHTNHFIGNWHGKIKDLTPYEAGSTYHRYIRTLRKLEEKEIITIEDLKEVFSDHFSYPNSICAHINPKDLIPVETLASIIVKLENKEIELAWGNPCKNKYKTYKINIETKQ